VRCWIAWTRRIHDQLTWSWLVHWLDPCRRSRCRTFRQEKTVLDWRAKFKTIIALSYTFILFTFIWLNLVRCWIALISYIHDQLTWSWLIHWLDPRSQCRTMRQEIWKIVLSWRAKFETIITLGSTFILCLPAFGWPWWGAGLLWSVRYMTSWPGAGWFTGWSTAGGTGAGDLEDCFRLESQVWDNNKTHLHIYSVYLHMADHGEVLDCLDQADSWPAELELVGSLAGALQEEPVQEHEAWDLEDCFQLESQVWDNNNTQLHIYSMFTCIWLTVVRCWIP